MRTVGATFCGLAFVDWLAVRWLYAEHDPKAIKARIYIEHPSTHTLASY